MEKNWYYKTGDESRGPLTQEELAGMLHRKEIDPKTLVKGGDLQDWVPIEELALTEPLLDVRPEAEVPLEETRMAEDTPRSRAWIRFVGRMFDYTWFGLIFGWILSGFGLTIDHAPFGIIFIPFAWIFVETLFMGTWGMTPGKWMIQTTVRKSDGKSLTFRDSISRSLSVWWLGMGAGVPFISFITMIVACVKLSNLGKTTWDRTGKFKIQHGRIGPFRIIGLIIFFFAFFSAAFPIVMYGN